MANVDHVTALADRLERAILVGRLQPGERLPSERELSSQWGVSRSVVREALGRLASLGLVSSKHGSGTRVQAPSTKQVAVGFQRLLSRPDFRMEHIAEVRLPLETTIAGLAAHHRTDEHIAGLQRTQEVLGKGQRKLADYVQADLTFHALLADATGNPLFALVLEPMQRLLIESRRRTLDAYGAGLAHEHHGAILDAVERRDAKAAAQAMRRHLEANFQHLQSMDDGSNSAT